jgi:mono-ADP-ribosyltransferase sirtuin 6
MKGLTIAEEETSFAERVWNVAVALRQSSKSVLFIGAGASASAGVPTFHGENKAESLLDVREDNIHFPNFTHRACKALLDSAIVEGAVSSNHDSLVSGPNVVEIFGSVLTETCLSCGGRFRRKFAPPPLNRKCECGGKLKKTGCRYGQAIHKPGLEKATSLSDNAEIALVLGSGMHTWPLSGDGFPRKAKRMIVVTLGATAADAQLSSGDRFNCTCDEFMEVLMKELALDVPPGVYEEEFVCKWTREQNYVSVVIDSNDPQEALTFTHFGTCNDLEFEVFFFFFFSFFFEIFLKFF